MSLINVNNLTFCYDNSYDNIFENVCFQIDTDWKLGFTGRNGRGKTTFLNLLMDKYQYEGTISKSVEFEYFPYKVDDSQYTFEIANSILQDYEEWQLRKELNLLDVSEDILYRSFNTLSNGEQTKILLAILFLKKNCFLLIDEPTNHLDTDARKILSSYLNKKNGFILVSHDRVFLDSCIDHVLSINKNDIEIQSGNFSSWWSNKLSTDNFELARNERLKSDIKRLETASKQAATWSDKVEQSKYDTKNSGLRCDRGYVGHKAAKMMQRSKAIERRQNNAIDEKSQLLKNIESADSLKIYPLKYHSVTLVELKDLSINYGENTIFSNINLKINNHDRIALCGKNGSGKSSIIKLICKEPTDYNGIVHIGSGLIISYVSQVTSFLQGNLSQFAKTRKIDESLFKAILYKLDFNSVQFDKDMENFSGGQKKKVLIAASLCEKAHLYIWDEPLNFIDVLSRIQIENLLREFRPTILFVEHDISFCNNVATKIVKL